MVSLLPATPVSSLFPILKGRRECGAAWPSVLWGSLGIQAAGGEPWAPGCRGSAVPPLPPTQSAPLLHCSASGSSTLLSLGVCSRVSSSGHTLSSPKLLGESCLLWGLNLSSCRECLSLSHCPSRHVPSRPAWTRASPVCGSAHGGRVPPAQVSGTSGAEREAPGTGTQRTLLSTRPLPFQLRRPRPSRDPRKRVPTRGAGPHPAGHGD